MKKLRFFDSLKFVVAAIVCTFILNVAHADTSINSVIAYGKTEQSGTPTPTSPVPIMTNNGVLKVNVSPSRNLFDKDISNVLIRGFPTNTGEFNPSESFRTVIYPLQIGETYTITRVTSTPTQAAMRVIAYNTQQPQSTDNGVVLSIRSVSSKTATITVPEGYPYVATYVKHSNDVISDAELLDGFQIELGSTATAYEPYSGPNGIYADGMVETIGDSAGHTATAQMLLGLNDTYRDEQNINTGAITRKVGVKVLDGTEAFTVSGDAFRTIDLSDKASGTKVVCSHFNGDVSPTTGVSYMPDLSVKGYGPNEAIFFKYSAMTTAEQFKSWLAEQYANGTPVIVVYPLAESAQTTETVATQTMTTAPVRQTAGSILGMPIEVILSDNTSQWVSEMITIATTKYNEEQFEPVQNRLSDAMNAVDTVVTQTMTQAQQIDQIATTKQTRPNESCPPFKKCLLVEGEDGTPHWYEIYDPINDFLNPILAAAALSGNQGAPIVTTHNCTGTGGEPASGRCYDDYNGFWHGNSTFLRKYIYASRTATTRPFGPTTLDRCTDNATRTTSQIDADMCYDTGGMFRTLTEGPEDDAGEWAVVYNGNEGGASLGITPGVVYGIAKCTSVGKRGVDGSYTNWPKATLAAANGGTTLSSLISEYPNSNIETVFNTLPNPVGTDDNPENPRANYRNCWCKMTAIGVPGSGETDEQRYANGTIMSVSGDWVSAISNDSLPCATSCAMYCGTYIQAYSTFRQNVLTLK